MKNEKKTEDENWNEEEGVLSLVEFKPQFPLQLSLGTQVAKDPIKREELKKIFLDAFRSTGSVVDAAKICQIPKSLAYTWRKQDPEFAYRWDQTLKTEMLPHLEAEAVRRALNGSDLMLIFMLKALDREKYDDKAAEKKQSLPSLTIKMVDVNNAAIAITNNQHQIPAASYDTGEVLNGTKVIPAEFEVKELAPAGNSDEPAASTERIGPK